jgi:hypothetical protein
MIKKFLGMFLNGGAVVLGIAMFLIALAPAISITITLPIVGSSTSTVSFYELFQFVGTDGYSGLSALIIIAVICLSLAIVCCFTSGSISLFLRKKMANVAAFSAFLGALNFLVAGILMFFILTALGNESGLSSLGAGAICNGIVGIIAAGVAGLAGLIDLKKIK